LVAMLMQTALNNILSMHTDILIGLLSRIVPLRLSMAEQCKARWTSRALFSSYDGRLTRQSPKCVRSSL
jgi:hypothetical protein